MQKLVAFPLFLSLLLSLSGPAAAVPCAGVSVGTASTDDVTLGGTAADDCVIAEGNAQGGSQGDVSLFSGQGTFGTGWLLLAKVTGNPVQGNAGGALITIGLPSPSGTSGSWSVSSNESILLDLVFAMHAGHRTGAFLFEDEALVANVTESGAWEIEWVNGGSQNPAYSNLTIFYRDPRLTVPVPGTLVLLLAAAATGIGFRFRFRQRSL